MSQTHKGLIVLMVALFGLWGCAQGPTKGPAYAERIKALESKIAKLEDDVRSSLAIRDQLRKRLASVEGERNQLGQQVEQLQLVAKERDDLRQQLTVRTSERDNLQSQYNQFRMGLKNLLGQMESTGVRPTTAAAELARSGKSS